MTNSIFNEFIFDQYSRYKACADLIRLADFTAGDSILDVGSGPECQFGRFMPDALMTFLDPLISESSSEHKIKGDLFSDKLDGRTFDYVTAVDVLEHVPPDSRLSFLNRIAALSEKILIVGFPSIESSDALAVDQDLSDKYLSIFKSDYSWLKEHHEYGLPSINQAIEFLEQSGWSCQTIGHGHTPWLKDMLGLVICAWEFNELKDIVLEISQEFNKNLYLSDFKAPHYRHFIIASRKPLRKINPPVSILNESESNSKFQELIVKIQTKILEVSFTKLQERDNALVERDNALVERDNAVKIANSMKISTSWQVTRPLRVIAKLSRYGLTSQDQLKIMQSLRYHYHRLPVHAKFLIRFAYHRIFQNVASQLRSIRIRKTPFQAPLVKPNLKLHNRPDYFIWGVIDWRFRFQRPQQLSTAIAANGSRVFYISSILIDDYRAGFDVELLNDSLNLFQVKLYVKSSPSIYANAPTASDLSQLTKSIGEVLNWAQCNQVISLVEHPFWCDVASVLPNSRLIYDCMDHHEGFGNNAESLMALEKKLFKKSALTITTSTWLDRQVAPYAKHRQLIRNAGDYQHFSKVPSAVYKDMGGRKIIGYYGAIAEWFDLDLVEAVAKQYPDCSVVLVGADTVNAKSRLGKFSNVTFIGEVAYADLPYYLYAFDVCLLPFKVIPLTLATNPVKAYEYLGAGKPIVTVDLPEMEQFKDIVYIAKDKEAFVANIANVLNSHESESMIEERKIFAAGQTWAHRTKELIKHSESNEREPKVSVIVLTYNNLDLTKACLSSLVEFSQYDNMEIIIVDNASTDGSPEFLSEWVSKDVCRKLILNQENLGFAAGNNKGLAAATGDYLLILNNDTYVTAGWVRTLVNHCERDRSIGLIGPVTNNIGNEAKINVNYQSMDEMESVASAYTNRHIGSILDLRNLAFFCVMMPKATYELIGGLDECFKLGFFEDDDYCRRVEKFGLKIVCAEDVFVHHHLSASFNKLSQIDRKQLFEENKAIYEAKWGTWTPHTYRSYKLPSKKQVVDIPNVFDGQRHIAGHCIVCGKDSRFFYIDTALWRESLNCQHCRSTSRYRSIAKGVLGAINELSGLEVLSMTDLPRTSNKRLRVYDTQTPFYYEPCAYGLPDLLKNTGWIEVELSNYKPNKPMGTLLAEGITNQNLESLTFTDESFDIVITSDVMEHVRLDDRAHREIYRVLKPGGFYIFTVPHVRSWDNTLARVKIVDPDDSSKDIQLLEPEYHGDTNSDSGGGVLAYRTYGRDIEEYLSQLGFAVDYSRLDMLGMGIMNTELYFCRKIK